MAKKYHQGVKDRLAESRGMERSEMKRGRGNDKRYMDMHERQENGRGFISEDHTALANMPQAVKMQEYPRFMYGLDPYLDDTIRGVDSQMYADDSQMKRHISKSKY